MIVYKLSTTNVKNLPSDSPDSNRNRLSADIENEAIIISNSGHSRTRGRTSRSQEFKNNIITVEKYTIVKYLYCVQRSR